jgi:hypothetical protein
VFPSGAELRKRLHDHPDAVKGTKVERLENVDGRARTDARQIGIAPPILITKREGFFSGRGARLPVSAGRSGSRAGVVEEAMIVSFRQYARDLRAGVFRIELVELDHKSDPGVIENRRGRKGSRERTRPAQPWTSTLKLFRDKELHRRLPKKM